MQRRGRILQAFKAMSIARDDGDNESRRTTQDSGPAESAVEKSESAQQPQRDDPQPPNPTVRIGRGARVLANLRAAQAARNASESANPAESERDQRQPQRARSRQSSNSEAAGSSDSAVCEAESPDRSASPESTSDASHCDVADVNDYRAPNLKVTGPRPGEPVNLSLNYITVETSDDTCIEEYHVEFDPNIESIHIRSKMLRSETAKEIIGTVYHWNGTNLYLPKRLGSKITNFTTEHPTTGQNVAVKLVYIKRPPAEELLQFYNSLMHKVMHRLKYVIFNRQHYSPLHKIQLDEFRLSLWPGWITSIQQLDGGLKLSVDTTFRVLRMETALDVMVEVRNKFRGPALKEAMEQELIGTIVMTNYNNKPYRIDEIDLHKRPTDTFIMGQGDNARKISYVDYMREHWNITINDVNQPMLLHRAKPKLNQPAGCEMVYLIPELCHTTGLTSAMRSNFTVMRALAQHTHLAPDRREMKIKELITQILTDERSKTVLDDWNLKLKPDLDLASGRRLQQETIIFGQDRKFNVPDNVDWTRPATNGPLYKTVSIESWIIIYTDRDTRVVEEFLETVKNLTRALGINVRPPRKVPIQNESSQAYVKAARENVKLADQMVVLMTPGKTMREDRYNACKRLLSVEIPVPCQFIRCGNVGDPRRMRSICQKILIQIVAKVGGQPWAIFIPMKSFMIVGIDVYHDTLDRKKSCVGFVCTTNQSSSTWFSRAFFQNSLEEIAQSLNITLMTALEKYQNKNGFVPEKIIVYRDGVGDAQMDAVLQIEVPQVMNAINFYMRDCDEEVPRPKLSYVIVQKRINTRFGMRNGNSCVNPPPGSYLDHTITHPEYNDFYLVSQHVNQGTAAPTKYVVLAETGSLRMDHHQKLAYKMTHMYYNWTGTIRVPAPCQYAHKLAQLTGQNIRQTANESLDEQLYYL